MLARAGPVRRRRRGRVPPGRLRHVAKICEDHGQRAAGLESRPVPSWCSGPSWASPVETAVLLGYCELPEPSPSRSSPSDRVLCLQDRFRRRQARSRSPFEPRSLLPGHSGPTGRPQRKRPAYWRFPRLQGLRGGAKAIAAVVPRISKVFRHSSDGPRRPNSGWQASLYTETRL